MKRFSRYPRWVQDEGLQRLYNRWCSMKGRCANPRDKAFKNYGARGIRVCEEWNASFRAFAAWALTNGFRPELSLEREDNDGPYSAENCRFATPKEQAANRRPTRRSPSGETYLHVAINNGIRAPTFWSRLRRGWAASEAASRLVARHASDVPERTKKRARDALAWAIKSGRVVRGACEDCGDPDTRAHHENYAKPLDVRWLCEPHHLAAHGKTSRVCLREAPR